MGLKFVIIVVLSLQGWTVEAAREGMPSDNQMKLIFPIIIRSTCSCMLQENPRKITKQWHTATILSFRPIQVGKPVDKL